MGRRRRRRAADRPQRLRDRARELPDVRRQRPAHRAVHCRQAVAYSTQHGTGPYRSTAQRTTDRVQRGAAPARRAARTRGRSSRTHLLARERQEPARIARGRRRRARHARRRRSRDRRRRRSRRYSGRPAQLPVRASPLRPKWECPGLSGNGREGNGRRTICRHGDALWFTTFVGPSRSGHCRSCMNGARLTRRCAGDDDSGCHHMPGGLSRGAEVAAGEPSRGADVAAGEPSSGADVAMMSRVPAQMWQGRAQSRCRCGRGEPSPAADVAAAQHDNDLARRNYRRNDRIGCWMLHVACCTSHLAPAERQICGAQQLVLGHEHPPEPIRPHRRARPSTSTVSRNRTPLARAVAATQAPLERRRAACAAARSPL